MSSMVRSVPSSAFTRARRSGTGRARRQIAPRVDLAVELRVGTREPEQLDEATRGAVRDLGIGAALEASRRL